jgi:Asp-tRNA(Asn)/Glu-tRNA(Gln) amidotransferase C subunit
MAESSMSKEALRALAESAGLNISDDVLEELLPRIRRSAETTAELDDLDLQGVEPATVFTSSSD